ncbi:hypothetical protein JTE90_008465 [Oedothorax gibbosus]|uniref:Uncharacterized protein n=1 Tax=Oedothorax gibbosus TaxID=931172 RepID=A0AAV6V0B2_9ARAC|nr:hypothetical protein JTE90_008465 [Oedothorax gibbosus]
MLESYHAFHANFRCSKGVMKTKKKGILKSLLFLQKHSSPRLFYPQKLEGNPPKEESCRGELRHEDCHCPALHTNFLRYRWRRGDEDQREPNSPLRFDSLIIAYFLSPPSLDWWIDTETDLREADVELSCIIIFLQKTKLTGPEADRKKELFSIAKTVAKVDREQQGISSSGMATETSRICGRKRPASTHAFARKNSPFSKNFFLIIRGFYPLFFGASGHLLPVPNRKFVRLPFLFEMGDFLTQKE